MDVSLLVAALTVLYVCVCVGLLLSLTGRGEQEETTGYDAVKY